MNTCRRFNAVEALAGLAGGECVLVADRASRRGVCRVEVSPAGFERALGGEFGAAIVSLEGLVRPNVLAGIAETVKGGGFLALVAPPLDSWDPGPPGGRGFYRRYLLSSIRRCRLHLWLEECGGSVKVVSESLKAPAARPDGESWEIKSRVGVPRRLMGLARTYSQALALEAGARFLRSGARTFFVRGDRGRGKSFLVGLLLALAIYWHAIGRAVVVGPSPLSVQSLLRGLLAGLEALGLEGRFKVVESGGDVVRVSGPWFRVSYEPPDTAEPAPMTVVDEAAAVGVARVRRLSWRGGKIIVSTTVHGYEGSGRSFAKLLPPLLPKPLVDVELVEPVRYPQGDPLEEWVYDTFLLKAEPSSPPDGFEPREVSMEIVDPGSLSPEDLGQLYGILVQAHYRNMPDDILAIMDSPHHTVHALRAGRVYIAVADVVEESDSVDREARIALERIKLLSGEDSTLKAFRVSRIAVHPDLQRRGLGSRLLLAIEAWARERGADLVTSMFSRHEVIGFWLRNGYTPFYVSPRYNRITGEKNVGVAKPLTERGRRALERAARSMLLRLLLSGSSVYRDLAAEKMAALIEAMPPAEPRLGLTEEQERMLRLYLAGEVDIEQAMDAVYIQVVRSLASKRPLPLSGRELVAVIARVVQGKPINEVASILSSGIDEAAAIVDRAVKRLIGAASEQYH